MSGWQTYLILAVLVAGIAYGCWLTYYIEKYLPDTEEQQ